MKLNTLRPVPGARKKRKRLGRGDASGHGGTSTKGHKGQKARTGVRIQVGFEGGQMPLIRRIPKRGFVNPSAKNIAIVNLDQLKSWPASVPVTVAALVERGLVRKRNDGVKLLGRGGCASALQVQLNQVSASARKLIEAAGGRVESASV